MDDLYKQILKLKKIPVAIFKSEVNEKQIILSKLKSDMLDDIANAFGGETSGGGYILDGDLWERTPDEQLTFLVNLHENYKSKVNQVKS